MIASYTIDGKWPVICTIIGQEPKFYFDEDE